MPEAAMGSGTPKLEMLRISCKNLGALNLQQTDCCLRCFWLKARMHWKLPHQLFASVFSSIDSFSKRLTYLYFQVHGRLPEWFADLGEPIHVPHHTRFQSVEQDGAVLLTGAPDDCFRKADGSLTICDYKTAKYTKTADSLKPVYEAQLNGYARISEKIGLGHVSQLLLAYYEPINEVTADDLGRLVASDHLLMAFKPVVIPVEIDAQLIPRLLARARELFDKAEPPKARDGCRDCALVEQMMTLMADQRVAR